MLPNILYASLGGTILDSRRITAMQGNISKNADVDDEVRGRLIYQ
ncbi:MAG: hypothetical protein R2814_18240 [Flavobacteriaceae bacterium]